MQELTRNNVRKVAKQLREYDSKWAEEVAVRMAKESPLVDKSVVYRIMNKGKAYQTQRWRLLFMKHGLEYLGELKESAQRTVEGFMA